MGITDADVQRVAKLAKLKFSPEDKKKMTHHLSDILTYMTKLNELNTEHVQPTHHVLGISNVLREDVTESWLTQEEALKNAPKKKSGFFSVPKVITHEK